MKYRQPASYLIALLLAFFITHFSAAQTSVGSYQSGFVQEGNTFSFKSENATVRLEFCTPDMVRVRTSWDGTFEKPEPWMVVQYEWPEVEVDATEEDDQFVLQTDALNITVYKDPFALEFADKEGKVLSTEKINGSGKSQLGGMQHGDSVMTSKQLMPDEHFFGFGERMDFLDRRGKEVKLNVGRGQGRPHIIGAYNILEANYSPVPFFMSTRGYGIFLHNSYATTWDMGASDGTQYSFKADGGELDYYFMYGPRFPTILDLYTTATGKSPLLPLYAFGLHVGTYSGGTWGHEEMTSTQYVVALAHRFRELGIPLDILHLDSTWRIFGKNGGSGATTFEWRPTFDHPEAMFDSLYALNLNMVGLHLRPRFDNGDQLNLLEQAQAAGYTYPEENSPGEFVNFFDSAAVNWWWKNGVKRVADQGAMFLKTDEGSAFGHKANESEKVGPTGEEIKRLHNVFPVAYAKAPYEKFSEYNEMRGMNHTREGYAGIQRYPFIFAGDWPSEWQYFGPVIKAGINIGLSGVGYWTHCMGGFEHNADPELYIRWVQFGMFSPVAHLFGMDHPGYKEPWNYGDEALEIFKQYDEMRYQLIPYLYSHAYKLYETGMPIMRALVLDYQDDYNVYEIGDQYMFGESMLVCPVTTKGAQTRTVYLPEGDWYNYWTGEKLSGKQYLNVLTPLDQMPIFIKSGAIIPRQEVVQYVGEKQISQLTIDIYPDSASTFTLYDDDGKSTSYQNGDYATTDILSMLEEEKTTVTINSPKGNFEVPPRTYAIQVHSDKKPSRVIISGKSVSAVESSQDLNAAQTKAGWYFDSEAQELQIKPGINSSKQIQITIQ